MEPGQITAGGAPQGQGMTTIPISGDAVEQDRLVKYTTRDICDAIRSHTKRNRTVADVTTQSRHAFASKCDALRRVKEIKGSWHEVKTSLVENFRSILHSSPRPQGQQRNFRRNSAGGAIRGVDEEMFTAWVDFFADIAGADADLQMEAPDDLSIPYYLLSYYGLLTEEDETAGVSPEVAVSRIAGALGILPVHDDD